jgi:hypothetical protein
MTEHVARGKERASAFTLEHLLTMGTEGVQLARVETLINLLLVDVHLLCCRACHLSWGEW